MECLAFLTWANLGSGSAKSGISGHVALIFSLDACTDPTATYSTVHIHQAAFTDQ